MINYARMTRLYTSHLQNAPDVKNFQFFISSEPSIPISSLFSLSFDCFNRSATWLGTALPLAPVRFPPSSSAVHMHLGRMNSSGRTCQAEQWRIKLITPNYGGFFPTTICRPNEVARAWSYVRVIRSIRLYKKKGFVAGGFFRGFFRGVKATINEAFSEWDAAVIQIHQHRKLWHTYVKTLWEFLITNLKVQPFMHMGPEKLQILFKIFQLNNDTTSH